jgi:hypothetical protein
VPTILLIFFDQPYFGLFIPIFQFGLFFLALFMGASLFSGFRKQKEIESLLTLPYSRLQLIGLKMLPKLSAVLFFYIIYLILYVLGADYYEALSFVSFTVIYFSLFLIALSFSANSDNLVVVFSTSLLFFIVFFGLCILVTWIGIQLMGEAGQLYSFNIGEIFTLEAEFSEPVFLFGLLAAISLLLPFIISFLRTFKKSDVRPAKSYNKRYFKFFALIFAVCFIISLGFTYLGMQIDLKSLDQMMKSYYLTQDHKLIESGFSSHKIYEEEDVYKFKGRFWYYWELLEENGYIYQLNSDGAGRLNTFDHSYETLYTVHSGKHSRGSWKYNQTIALFEFEKKPKGIQVVLIDETTKKVERIPVEHELLKDYFNPTIFGTDTRDGKRFWLVNSGRVWKYPLLRIWEDGKAENIGKSQIWPCYVNQMLITYSEEDIIISKEKGKKYEIVKKIPNKDELRFSFRAFRNNLNNVPIKEMYTWRKKKAFRLNLEILEIEEIKGVTEYLRFIYPDHYYFVRTDREAGERSLYQLKDGKEKLLKTFPYEQGDIYFLSRNGIILTKGKKAKVYAFPDFQEIKFNKL